jgi:predicted ATP-dependent serine protease
MAQDEKALVTPARVLPADVVQRLRGPRLVGRDTELEGLARQVDRVFGGGLRVILIPGAPGAGKTRLAAEVLARFGGNWRRGLRRSYR